MISKPFKKIITIFKPNLKKFTNIPNFVDLRLLNQNIDVNMNKINDELNILKQKINCLEDKIDTLNSNINYKLFICMIIIYHIN